MKYIGLALKSGHQIEDSIDCLEIIKGIDKLINVPNSFGDTQTLSASKESLFDPVKIPTAKLYSTLKDPETIIRKSSKGTRALRNSKENASAILK